MCAALFGLMAVCSTIVFTAPACGRGATFGGSGGQPIAQERAPVEEQVQVALGRLDPRHARDVSQRAGQFLGDHLRRLPERPRQLEGHGQREVAQFARGRVVDDDGGNGVGGKTEARAEGRRDPFPDECVEWKYHRSIVDAGSPPRSRAIIVAVSARRADARVTKAERPARGRPAC